MVCHRFAVTPSELLVFRNGAYAGDFRHVIRPTERIARRRWLRLGQSLNYVYGIRVVAVCTRSQASAVFGGSAGIRRYARHGRELIG